MILGLAPMDGITDLAYRQICQNIFQKHNNNNSHELFLWTEFMSSDGYIANPKGVIRHIITNSKEENLYGQIFGGNKDNLIKTAIDLDKVYRYKGVELNIGCPAPKIVNNGGGSALMKDKEGTLEIIKEIRNSIDCSFSIKTRSGLKNDDKEAQFKFILEASNYCDIISIHGRTYSAGHSGDVDWDYIYKTKELANPNSKVVGNGGIKTYQDILDKQNNLDGIMIGQGAIGNPWIFVDYEPSEEDKYNTIIEHLLYSAIFEIYFTSEPFEGDKLIMPTDKDFKIIANQIENRNETITINNKQIEISSLRSPVEYRKHLFCYLKGIRGSKEFKVSLIHTKKYYKLLDKINEFFDK